MITATNRHTGEVVELPVESFKEIVQAWQIAQEYAKTADALKDQLKTLVPKYINDKGVSEESGGYMFRQSSVQRKSYDKSVMREVLDQDTYDLLLKPDKTGVDKFLKDLVKSGDPEKVSTTLRDSMIPDGTPYSVTKLEKLDR